MVEWNEEKEKQILKKYKSRFSFRLTFKIIRVLVAVFLLYWAYMMVVTISYHSLSKTGDRVELYQTLSIDWTYPEVSSEIFAVKKKEITPFLTQKMEIPLERTIGKNSYVVSHLQLTKPIFTGMTHSELTRAYPYENGSERFSFYLPIDPISGAKLIGNQSFDVWDTLEKIHEGNVADLAFSTNAYYSPEQLLQLLEPYDLDVLWMPLYMGELKQFTEGVWGGGDNSIGLYQPWGLAGARVIDTEFKSGYRINTLTLNTIEESQGAMLSNIEMMLNKDKKLAEQLLGTSYLQERYDYLKENGFQAYGAVVTGPVKELLQLKELQEIHSGYLGEIKHWNWHEGKYE
ncbi:MAG: anti sigma factor C-terminal domain-containing protein [Anaerobacillus sp.]|uniref:anti-sigma factor n=1 Tax=Anaerobacillus sp. TaxID=1872506 RepID=UPI00391CD292